MLVTVGCIWERQSKGIDSEIIGYFVSSIMKESRDNKKHEALQYSKEQLLLNPDQ